MRDVSQPAEQPGAAACRGCGRPAGPSFCGHCGQELEARRGPLLAVLRELLADWLSLDGRLLRTLTELAHPGRLTTRYLEGKRITYLRPFRLYLIASLLLFSSLLSLRAPDATTVNLYVGGQLVTEAPAVQGRLDLTLFEPKSALSRWLANQQTDHIEELRRLPPQELLDALFAGLRRVLPAAFILFVPFLALGLKALYWRKKILFLDHLVFALHFQSALFLALAATWGVCRLLGLALFLSILAYLLAGCFMLFVYMPLALRRMYRQRWRWTIAKAVLVIVIYGQLMTLISGGATLLVTSALG